jgi:uncharacterized protein (DUF58 family)
MINETVSLKKLLLTALMLLFAVCMGNLHAQNLDFKIKTDSTTTAFNEKKVYSINIEITSGEAPFSVFLYDKAPWLEGKIIDKKENIFDKKIILTKISSGRYCLIVTSGNNSFTVNKTIKL